MRWGGLGEERRRSPLAPTGIECGGGGLGEERRRSPLAPTGIECGGGVWGRSGAAPPQSQLDGHGEWHHTRRPRYASITAGFPPPAPGGPPVVERRRPRPPARTAHAT